MRKIIISLLMIVILFSSSGCTNNNEIELNNNKSVKIKDSKLEFTESSSFKSISFKYPKKAIINSVGSYTVVTYPKETGADPLFEIALTSFEGKGIEEVMSSSSATPQGTKTVNGKEWNYYSDSVSGTNTITYAYHYNNDTYTITFISTEDIKTLSELFMKDIIFN